MCTSIESRHWLPPSMRAPILFSIFLFAYAQAFSFDDIIDKVVHVFGDDQDDSPTTRSYAETDVKPRNITIAEEFLRRVKVSFLQRHKTFLGYINSVSRGGNKVLAFLTSQRPETPIICPLIFFEKLKKWQKYLESHIFWKKSVFCLKVAVFGLKIAFLWPKNFIFWPKNYHFINFPTASPLPESRLYHWGTCNTM